MLYQTVANKQPGDIPSRPAICEKMSIDTIINGKVRLGGNMCFMHLLTFHFYQANVFPGFIPLIRRYLDSVEIEVNARCSITEYLSLLSKRAKGSKSTICLLIFVFLFLTHFVSGEYMTAAQWMRHFVMSHPDYKHDSVVTDSIAYDLLMRCDQIEKGEVKCHQLFGTPKHKSEYVH